MRWNYDGRLDRTGTRAPYWYCLYCCKMPSSSHQQLHGREPPSRQSHITVRRRSTTWDCALLAPNVRASWYGLDALCTRKKATLLFTKKERDHVGIRTRDLCNWNLTYSVSPLGRNPATRKSALRRPIRRRFGWIFTKVSWTRVRTTRFVVPPYVSIIHGVLAFVLLCRNLQSL